MSSENDERIAAAIAKRKAVIKAEEEQARAAQDAQKKRQMTYDQAAGKFRQDFRNIEVFIEMRNSGLHDIGIILGGDGGRASQNGNHLNYTVNMNRPPNGRQFSLVFSLTDKGLSHHIETITGNRRNESPTINVSDADSKYYDDALTEYIETILAAYED